MSVPAPVVNVPPRLVSPPMVSVWPLRSNRPLLMLIVAVLEICSLLYRRSVPPLMTKPPAKALLNPLVRNNPPLLIVVRPL